MNINDLFCTPEQGRRLAELVPSLNHLMVWVRVNNNKAFDDKPYFDGGWIEHTPKGTEIQPALTLQELRDVVKKIDDAALRIAYGRYMKASEWSEFEDMVMYKTAPELAAWVIKRLEETP